MNETVNDCGLCGVKPDGMHSACAVFSRLSLYYYDRQLVKREVSPNLDSNLNHIDRWFFLGLLNLVMF